MRTDIDPTTYVNDERARIKWIARQLRLVESFKRRLEAQFPKNRKPEVAVSLIEDEDDEKGPTVQVEVVGRYTKRQHPYTVDGAVRAAGEGTAFWDAFELKGTLTDRENRLRDNTFWERSEYPAPRIAD